MRSESIIGKEGAIRLLIRPDRATWFNFLAASRAASVDSGGWESREYWVPLGLDVLAPDGVPADFVEQWTVNSLGKNALPRPRKDEFLITDRTRALQQRCRGDALLPEGSENALNFAVAQSLFDSLAPNQSVVTYELPLAADSAGQLKADVVVFGPAGHVEIIELKKSGIDGSPDSPLMALTEAICYSVQMIRCWRVLAKTLPKHNRAIQPQSFTLTIAAPDYWANCRGKGARIRPRDVQRLRAIVDTVASVYRRRLKNDRFSITLRLTECGTNGGPLTPIE